MKDIENKDDVKNGDIVMLKSGGPYMTVFNTQKLVYNLVDCMWYDIKHRLQISTFNIQTLRKEVQL